MVLLTTLLILAVVALLSLAAAGASLLQEKMTGALAEGHRALQAAEAALRTAEARVAALERLPEAEGEPAFYRFGQAPGPRDLPAWRRGTRLVLPAMEGAGRGRYLIEHLATLEPPGYRPLNQAGYGTDARAVPTEVFRLLAEGRGRDGGARRVVRAYYAHRF